MDVHLLSALGQGETGKAEHRLLKLLGHETEAGGREPRERRLLPARLEVCAVNPW